MDYRINFGNYEPYDCKNYKKYDRNKCRCKVDGSIRRCKWNVCPNFKPKMIPRFFNWLYFL